MNCAARLSGEALADKSREWLGVYMQKPVMYNQSVNPQDYARKESIP